MIRPSASRRGSYRGASALKRSGKARDEERCHLLGVIGRSAARRRMERRKSFRLNCRKRLESCIFALVRGRSRPEAFQPRRFRQDLPPDADSCLRVAAQGRRNRPDQKLRTVAPNKRKYCTAKQQPNNNAKCDYGADETAPIQCLRLWISPWKKVFPQDERPSRTHYRALK